MKKAIALLAALSALALALPAGAKPDNKPAWAGPGLETTIVGTAVALSGGEGSNSTTTRATSTSSWRQFSPQASTNPSSTALTNYTVFAPTDQAFLDVASSIADVRL